MGTNGHDHGDVWGQWGVHKSSTNKWGIRKNLGQQKKRSGLCGLIVFGSAAVMSTAIGVTAYNIWTVFS